MIKVTDHHVIVGYIVTYDSVSHFKKGEFAQVDYPSVRKNWQKA